MRTDVEVLRKKAAMEQERGSSSLAFKEKIGRQEQEIANLTLQVQDLELRAQTAESTGAHVASDLQAKDKETSRLKVALQALKLELQKVSEERDQLIEVSANLRAELSMMRSSVEVDVRASRPQYGTTPYTQPLDAVESSIDFAPAAMQTKSGIPKYERLPPQHSQAENQSS